MVHGTEWQYGKSSGSAVVWVQFDLEGEWTHRVIIDFQIGWMCQIGWIATEREFKSMGEDLLVTSTSGPLQNWEWA